MMSFDEFIEEKFRAEYDTLKKAYEEYQSDSRAQCEREKLAYLTELCGEDPLDYIRRTIGELNILKTYN